jgi:hypothetical protein
MSEAIIADHCLVYLQLEISDIYSLQLHFLLTYWHHLRQNAETESLSSIW